MIFEVLEDDWRILNGRKFETIGIDCAEDADTFAGEVADLSVGWTILDGCPEEDFDESADIWIERIAKRQSLQAFEVPCHQLPQLLQRLRRNSVVFSLDPFEEMVHPDFEGPLLPGSLESDRCRSEFG